MKIETRPKSWILASAGIVAGGLIVFGIRKICTPLKAKRARKTSDNHKASHSVPDTEKIYVNIAAGASVSIPMTAQRDIDIHIASGNGDNRENPAHKQEDNVGSDVRRRV